MSKGITYTGTFADGRTTSRYSARHAEAVYTHAVDKRGSGATGGASFHGSLAAAQTEAATFHKHCAAWATRNGKPVPARPEIVRLDAVPGKAKRAA